MTAPIDLDRDDEQVMIDLDAEYDDDIDAMLLDVSAVLVLISQSYIYQGVLCRSESSTSRSPSCC